MNNQQIIENFFKSLPAIKGNTVEEELRQALTEARKSQTKLIVKRVNKKFENTENMQLCQELVNSINNMRYEQQQYEKSAQDRS